jgi:cytochrome P450
MLIVWLLLAVVAYCLLVYFMNGGHRVNAPPHIRGFLPYIGDAISLQKSIFGYLEQNAAKYGKIFSSYVMGQTMVFITDSEAFNYFYKNEDIFDGYLPNRPLQEKLMKIPQSLNTRDFWKEHVSVTLKSLQGKNLENMSLDFLVHSKIFLDKKVKSSNQKITENLFQFIYDLTFESSFRAVFGEDFDIVETKKDFEYFDENWKPYLMTNIPAIFFSKIVSARDRIIDRLSKIDPKKSYFMEKYFNLTQEHGGGFGMGILFAAMANSINSTFWLVAYILNDPELKREIDIEIEKFNPNDVLKSIKEMPLLESCIDEVFRIASQLGSVSNFYFYLFSLGTAAIDTTMKIDGKEFTIYKGDKVLVASIDMMNEEIFENPKKFDGKRFLVNKFPIVNGKPKKHAVIAFGGGSHVS